MARERVLVTDIHMPGERDGIAVGRHARRRRPTIPVIYTTGRPVALNGAGLLGPRDVLVRKPYVPSQVVVAPRRFLPATGGADSRLPEPFDVALDFIAAEPHF